MTDTLQPPLARKPPAPAPKLPTCEQEMECCLLSLRDCLQKMHPNEITVRGTSVIDRMLALLRVPRENPWNAAPDTTAPRP